MVTIFSRIILATALTLCALPGWTCGFCVEDKVAAVYDHAVVTAAIARRHQVAFFGIEGRLAGNAAEARGLERIAAGVHGVDDGSARVNTESASLSVAFDPASVSYAVLHRYLQRRFSPRGLVLLPLRIMEKSAELITAVRP